MVQEGIESFRPRAGIIKTIGEELISNDTVAILELVKNSYDADATKVEIHFTEPLQIGKGGIIIKDNGIGMDLNTVRKGWMEPATIIKRRRKKSTKDRKLLGEKGIGRFASAKLARELELITKKKKEKEIRVQINWDEFDNLDKYLDEIWCKWKIIDDGYIEGHGTTLKLIGLTSNWNEEKLRELNISLSRLINPFAPIEDFEIKLYLPKEFIRLEGKVSPPNVLQKPDYSIKGNISSDGNANITYYSKRKNINESIVKVFLLKNSVSGKVDRKPSCGPFEFEFRVWDRDLLVELSEELGIGTQEIRKDLDSAPGISIYRDGFRVLPYGEKKNDWLRLDIRRVQNPTLRLSNNQVKGYLSISNDNNPILKDQSNREGIIESKEFNDFKDLIILILNEIEPRRYKERPRKFNKEVTGLFSQINIDPLMQILDKKLPGDSEAKQIFIETDSKIKEGIKRVQEVLSRYRRLSTLGLLLDVVLHDGNGILLRIENESLILKKELKKESLNIQKCNQHIDFIINEKNTLSKLFIRLEPFSGKRRNKPRKIILEEYIQNVFELLKGKLKDIDATISIPNGKTEIIIDESDVEIIFVNLLENSIYWLGTLKQKDNKIFVDIDTTENDIVIIFSDNGLGINPEDIGYIFDPYFSRKPDGIGLGLTIVGEIIAEYGGIFDLIDSGPLPGANFRIILRRENNGN